MELTFDQICSITSGAIRMVQKEDGIHFCRFTQEQTELEHPYVHFALSLKHWATAGIRLSFRTDSATLGLRADMSVGSGRGYYALDVVVNGTLLGGPDNFSQMDLSDDYTVIKPERGAHEVSFDLGPGEKDVRIHLPWGTCTVLQGLSLEDGASIHPLVPSKKLLAFGDSITQGYDVLRPSLHHVTRLGLALDAAVHNQALGGAVSFPELVRARVPFDPDYILVAYGTNDWSKITLEDFLSRYRALLAAIRDNYPAAQVFLITPIWRRDCAPPTPFGPFDRVEQHIRAIAADYPAYHVIRGFDLVPHESRLFADERDLHPNDAGFDCYFNNLWPQIKALLKE